MGRTLSNTMMNLGLQATVDEALYQVHFCLQSITLSDLFAILGVCLLDRANCSATAHLI